MHTYIHKVAKKFARIDLSALIAFEVVWIIGPLLPNYVCCPSKMSFIQILIWWCVIAWLIERKSYVCFSAIITWLWIPWRCNTAWCLLDPVSCIQPQHN